MRLELLIGGVLLTIFSIPAYYYAPPFLTQEAHSFVLTMTSGNAMNSVAMLHQMGYPPLKTIIALIQYLLVGSTLTGMGFVGFGLVMKKSAKKIAIKVVADEQTIESIPTLQKNPKTNKGNQTSPENEQMTFGVVNDVLSKLENELKDIKSGYENHRQTMEEEKKSLEQKERERMAKIIATGEVLIKEITPDKFEERMRYYMELKNEETGLPTDLSLLAEKFEKMKKTSDPRERSDLTPSEFDNFKRFLDD